MKKLLIVFVALFSISNLYASGLEFSCKGKTDKGEATRLTRYTGTTYEAEYVFTIGKSNHHILKSNSIETMDNDYLLSSGNTVNLMFMGGGSQTYVFLMDINAETVHLKLKTHTLYNPMTESFDMKCTFAYN